jgi:hypothetical protein
MMMVTLCPSSSAGVVWNHLLVIRIWILFDYFDVDFDFESSSGSSADCEDRCCTCFDCCCSSFHGHFVVD